MNFSHPNSVIQKSRADFFSVIHSTDFYQLPNIQIKVPPLIQFNLHDIAEDNWYLKVRQKVFPTFQRIGGGHVGRNEYKFYLTTGRPKITLRNNTKNIYLVFDLPSLPLFQSIEEVFVALEKSDYKVRSTRLVMDAISLPDVAIKQIRQQILEENELEILREINDFKYKKLKDRRPNNTAEEDTNLAEDTLKKIA